MPELANHSIDIERYNKIIQHCFFIVDKKRNKVHFKPNNIQTALSQKLKKRNIVLKARKEGVSSYILALWMVACIYEQNINAVVISHEQEATKRLYERARYYLDNMLPTKPSIERSSSRETYFRQNNSKLYIGTAGQKAFGHGDDISHLHISELAFYEKPEMIYGLVEACIDDSIVVIESTANGVGGLFHNMWDRAERGETDWNPIFFGWHENPEYRAYMIKEQEYDVALNEEEKSLQKTYNLTFEQLMWRRRKIKSMPDSAIFPQEYPINAVEAFISTGRKFFDTNKLQLLYNCRLEPNRVGEMISDKYNRTFKFVSNPTGILRLWELPKGDALYAIGADVAGGSDYEQPEDSHDTSAYSACVVKDRKTWETVAVVNCKLTPDAWADYLNMLGTFYNNAIIGVEDNNMGIATINHLLRICNYPNLYRRTILDEATRKSTKKVGWHTDIKSKPVMMNDLNLAIKEETTKINDETTIRQMLSYIIDKHNKLKPQAGSFADLVIAEAIAVQICQENPVATKHYVPKEDKRKTVTEGSGYG
jgi:hypothetical protein